MKIRLKKENLNTAQYLNSLYSQPSYLDGYGDGQKRLIEEANSIKKIYPIHLDIGCCDGTFTKYYLQKSPKCWGLGVDISDVAVQISQWNCPEGDFMTSDCYSLPFPKNFFDMAHCAEVIEHLEQPEMAIKEIHRVLKPKGILFLTTINESAGDNEEHLWKWDLEGVVAMMGKFNIIKKEDGYFNGHMLRITAVKK